MIRVQEALLTAREWWRTSPEPDPRPMPGEARLQAVVTPDTEAAEWVAATVPPVPEDGCFHCDRTPAQHGLLPMERCVQYAALIGEHRWTRPTQEQVTGRRRARDRAADGHSH